MPNQASISVVLPESLIDRVREQAGGSVSFDHVVSVALERELERRDRFKQLLDRKQAWGRSIGIRSEQDAIRLANGDIALEDLKRSA